MEKPKAEASKKPDFQPYLQAILAAWGFVLALAVTAFFICGAVWDDVTSGVMEFLFVVLGGGFTLAALLNYFYDGAFHSRESKP